MDRPCWRATFRRINLAAQALSPAAVDSKDDKQPYTDSYNFTVSQRTPWSGLLEVAYVGNQSRDLAISSGAGIQHQPGPVGAMLCQQERRRRSQQPDGQ